MVSTYKLTRKRKFKTLFSQFLTMKEFTYRPLFNICVLFSWLFITASNWWTWRKASVFGWRWDCAIFVDSRGSSQTVINKLSIVSSNKFSVVIILLIVPGKPLWGGDNKVYMYVIPIQYWHKSSPLAPTL